MKQTVFDESYLSALCLGFAWVLSAGIPLDEGLLLLAEEEEDSSRKALLSGLYEESRQSMSFAAVLRNADAFPAYMVSMVEVGEQTGYLESVFRALASYYERKRSIRRMIRGAVTYPALLFCVMLLVMGVLVAEVLPVFQNVFTQLGVVMSPVALAFLRVGQGLHSARFVLLGLAVVLAAAALAVRFLPGPRQGFAGLVSRLTGSSKRGKEIAAANLASVLAMTFSSGLDMEQALELAERVVENPRLRQNVTRCRELLSEGRNLAQAVAETKIFDSVCCRMLSIGVKTGALDNVMEEIARRNEEAVAVGLERTVGRVEPALIVVLSLLIGLILLSVMLPLMGIMSSLA